MSKRNAVVASIALCFAPMAQAASSSSVELGDFSWVLIDLDSSDGIAPSINWGPAAGSASKVEGVVVDGGATVNDAYEQSGAGPWGSASGTARMAVSSAASSVYSNGNPATLNLHAGGSAEGSLVAGEASSYTARAAVPFDSSVSFSLSPNTAVVFSVLVEGTARTTTGSMDSSAMLAGVEWANAYAALSVSGSGAGGTGGAQNTLSEMSVVAGAQGGEPAPYAQSSFYAGVLSGAFVNASVAATSGLVSLTLLATGGSAVEISPAALGLPPAGVAAVPEPETYAMMVAGLGLLGLMSRNRLRGR
jgi:hypothetical protein